MISKRTEWNGRVVNHTLVRIRWQVPLLTFSILFGSSKLQFDVKKDQYFKNIVQGTKFYNLKNYANLGKPVDKDR